MILILKGLIIITVFIVLPLESYAFRHLDEQNNVSPSPSPFHGVDFQETCNIASRSCQLKNIAACLNYSQTGSQEVYLLVQNKGENPLNVKVMILPANNIFKEIQLASHQMEKIKISSDINLTSSISLNSEDGDCIIHSAAPAPQNQFQKYPSYETYITPTNGAYLVILVLIVGAIFICFKLRFRGRHLDGVPYHELEMGNSTAISSLNMEEKEAENWDQDWDEEWGDEKNVKKGIENLARVEQSNELTVKLSDSNGTRKEWND